MTTDNPQPLGDEYEHYWLVQQMARATDVDLAAAFDAGQITSEDWSEVLTRCRGCAWVGGCKAWLQAGDDTARSAPQACRNADTFERLAEKPKQQNG